MADPPAHSQQKRQHQLGPGGLLINTQQVGDRDKRGDQRTNHPDEQAASQPVGFPGPSADFLEGNVETAGGESAELAAQVNPAITTFTDFLDAVDTRFMDIEIRAGRGPFAAAVFERVKDIAREALGDSGESLTIIPIFTGVLARAQIIQQELAPIVEGLATLVPVWAEFPDMKLGIEQYNLQETIAKLVGWPVKKLLKDEDEFNKIIEAVTAARQAQQQQQQAIEMAKASKDMSGPVDPNSILAGAGELVGAG